MESARWERWAPAAGIVFLVLFLAGVGMFVQFPALGDPQDEYASFYSDNRGGILAASILLALSLLFFLAFAVAVASRLRDAGERQLAGIALAGTLVWLAVGYVVIGVHAAIALAIAEDGDPESVKALSVVALGADVVGSFPFATLPIAVGLAALRTSVLPGWFGWASLGVGAVAVLAGTTWAREGFWSPEGTFGWIAIVVLLAWTAAASLLLLLRPRAADAPRPAAAM